jgi:hypothetical protein
MRLLNNSNVVKNKLLFLIIVFVAAVIGATSDTRAQCDCVGYTPEVRGSRYGSAVEDLMHSEVVFIGEVVETRKVARLAKSPNEENFEIEIRFKVQRAWKRAVDEYVTVRNNGDHCIFTFETGKQYLVYAVAEGDLLRTWYCSRTRLAERAKKDLDEFESKGVRPTEIKHAPKP